MNDNSEAWSSPDVVSYFDNQRVNSNDIYPSEWFFLKNSLKENIRILDIGCAQGGFSNAIKNEIKNFTYTGIDISESMITQAKKNYPHHTFYHIKESDDYSILKSEDKSDFDLTLVLGILHLHETWRETVAKAWNQTSGILILDLRVVFEASIEDKEKSYFRMDFNGRGSDSTEILPYNLINTSEALSSIYSICKGAQKISYYGYSQKVSDSAVCPIKDVFANVYCIER